MKKEKSHDFGFSVLLKKYRAFLGILIGDETNFTHENRIFCSATFLTTLIGLVAMYWNISAGLSLWINVVIALAVVIYYILYYFARFRKAYSSIVFFAFAIPFLSLLWFLNEGSKGSVPLMYLLAITTFIAISKSRYHVTFFLVTLANIVLLYVLELSFYDALIVPYPNNKVREDDLRFVFIISFMMFYILISYFKRNYDKENETIRLHKIKLQELNAMKDKLFSIIGHDLKSPFNNLWGFTRLMADKSKSTSLEEMRKYAGLINNSFENTNRLLENLLEWAKIHKETLLFEPEALQLHDIIEQSLETLREISAIKQISIRVNVPGDIRIVADKNMLQIIMRNLISNAIKFSNKGDRIEILSNVIEGNEIKLLIEDTGIGMSEEILENLFKINANTGRMGTNGETSTGLGLLICKEFLDKHGGHISVRSKEGVGSQVEIRLKKA